MTEREEDEMICQKILGYSRYLKADGFAQTWLAPHSQMPVVAPDFSEWVGAGMILDAIRYTSAKLFELVSYSDGEWQFSAIGFVVRANSGPAVIRKAALKYIERL